MTRSFWTVFAVCVVAGVVTALALGSPGFAIPVVVAVLLLDALARRRGITTLAAGMLLGLGGALLISELVTPTRNCPANLPSEQTRQPRICDGSRSSTGLLVGPTLLAAGTITTVLTARHHPAAPAKTGTRA